MNESTNHKDNIYTGNVSLGDILEVLPFRSTIERVEVMGSTLRKVLEHSVSNLNPDDPQAYSYNTRVSNGFTLYFQSLIFLT